MDPQTKARDFVRTFDFDLTFYIGACKGGSSFDQLRWVKGMKINNGSVLVDGIITWPWQNVQFWRAFMALLSHYASILIIGSLSLKLGIVTNEIVETKIEELTDRPGEDSATMFSFVKQQFFHKTLAYVSYEKRKVDRQNNKGKCKLC